MAQPPHGGRALRSIRSWAPCHVGCSSACTHHGSARQMRTFSAPCATASHRQPQRRHLEAACRAQQQEALPDAAFDPLARFEGQLRALPLGVGAAGIAGTLLNRVLSGIAPVADAGSAQSRADVLLIGMCGALVLTGLQWLALAPKEAASVEPRGQRLDWVSPGVSAAAAEELRWAWRALSTSSRCCGLVAFWDGKCICQLGAAAGPVAGGGAQPGELVGKCAASGRGDYLANLVLYPGRFEFLQYFPDSTQGAALAPLGTRGCFVAAVDAVRGFSRLDQAWLAMLADKLDSTLESGDSGSKDAQADKIHPEAAASS